MILRSSWQVKITRSLKTFSDLQSVFLFFGFVLFVFLSFFLLLLFLYVNEATSSYSGVSWKGSEFTLSTGKTMTGLRGSHILLTSWKRLNRSLTANNLIIPTQGSWHLKKEKGGSENASTILSTHRTAHNCLAPVPEDPMTSSDFCWHQVCTWCTDTCKQYMHTRKTKVYIKDRGGMWIVGEIEFTWALGLQNKLSSGKRCALGRPWVPFGPLRVYLVLCMFSTIRQL